MIETFSHPHLENCSSTIIMTRVKTKQNKTKQNRNEQNTEKALKVCTDGGLNFNIHTVFLQL